MKKKKLKTNNSSPKKTLTTKIISILSNSPKKSFNIKQLARMLNFSDNKGFSQIEFTIADLNKTGLIKKVTNNRYAIKNSENHILGKVELISSGDAYIITDQLTEDVFVSKYDLNHALNGDIVKVAIYTKHSRTKLEGKVIEIVERKQNSFVGTLSIVKTYGFLVSDNKAMPYDIYIPAEKLNKAQNGQKVIVKIIEWPKQSKSPIGEVIEILGYPGDNEAEMHAVMAEYDLPYHFPTEVELEANAISEEITEQEINKRRDFRNITTFTIDPADAKDFDDALSIRKLNNNLWEVGIHIADVTYYVKPNTLIDNEAYKRATSVYLVDRCIPMLPEHLSNYLCSLRPNEDKFCYSAVFELDDNADIKSQWFGKTIIHSKRRFTYEEAFEIIERGNGDLAEELLILNKLAKKLRSQRFAQGAISFERNEIKIKLDEAANPIGVYLKEYNDANRLIEEFMLLANKKVAEFIGKHADKKLKRAFVYRIHDKPDSEKINLFSQFIKQFGHTINTKTNRTVADSMNTLFNKIKGKPEQNVIETLAIRSMAKASYSTLNIGHYGLAFKYYTHFTSPIRRYPDMMVHRLLEHYSNNGKSFNEEHLEKKCKHASDMEERAAEAERTSIKYKQVEFLKDKIGTIFKGVISGITSWGIFVEIIENKCEGIVPIRNLNDDFYTLDSDNYRLIGKHSGKIYQLGQEVSIQIIQANLSKKQLIFNMIYEQ